MTRLNRTMSLLYSGLTYTIVILALSAGVDDNQSPPEPSPAFRTGNVSLASLQRPAPQSNMTQRLASQIPEYGGAFIDKQGAINVYLTDLSVAATARPVVERELNAVGPPNRTIRFLKADYRYEVLASFANLLGPSLSRGVSMYTVDDRRNRFLIYVVTDQDRDRIVKAIIAAKLPLAAILIEKAPLAVPATTKSL